MLGGEPAARDCGVDEGNGMKHRDLWLQQTYLYCKEVIQHNENANKNVPIANRLLLEGEWTAYPSGEMTDSKGVELEGCKSAGMDEGMCVDEMGSDAGWEVEHRDTPNKLMHLLTTTVEPYTDDGDGNACVYLGGTCWHAGDTSRPKGQSDVLIGQMDMLDESNSAEMANMNHSDSAGTYLGAGGSKCNVKEMDGLTGHMDGIGSHVDMSTVQTDVSSVETNLTKPANETGNVRMR